MKAVALDNTLAEAHAVLAFNIYWFEWAWDTAEAHFRRALELDPHSADTLWMYAHLPSNAGRHEQALSRDRPGTDARSVVRPDHGDGRANAPSRGPD